MTRLPPSLADADTTVERREESAQPRKESDSYRGDIPSRPPIGLIRDLSEIRPVRSTVAIGLEWGGIVAALAVHHRFQSLLLLPVLVMWIGARQHALGILMHEGVHYHLYRNRRLNEAASELFLAWPLFVTACAYRYDHFAHHRHVNTERDPDMMRKQGPEWMFPKTWPALGWLLLKDVFGLNTYQQVKESADLSGPKGASPDVDLYRIARYAYYASMVGLVTYFHVWTVFLVLWMVPLLTWFKAILRIRSIAEHYSVENDHVYTMTRTTLPSWFERMFVAPRNINYHLEHHLYPSVPFFRLPQLHAAMMQDAEFKARAHVTQTYWGVLAECVGRR